MGDMSKRRICSFLLTAMVVLLIVETIACTAIGAADISFMDALKAVAFKINFLKGIISKSGIKESTVTIITGIRLPRVILAAFIGSALPVAGASYQGLFKNSLADPYIVGASSGGALGAAIAIIIKSKLGISGFSMVPFFAFAGALISTYVVYILGRIGGKLSITAMMLSGIAVNSMLSAVLSMLLLFNHEQMDQVIMWTMGSLQYAGWEQIEIVAPCIVAGIAVMYFFSRDLNLMMLGEEQAQHLGVNTKKLKKTILFAGAFITGVSVSVSGIIGFVGVFIPHIARILLGPDNRLTIPFSAIFGAMFLMIADSLARTLISPMEIPVGVLTAGVGGPFFIYLLLKNKNSIE